METTRALNLSMTVAQVDRHCRENGVAISVLEALPDGGTRLVCMSNYGAAHQAVHAETGERFDDLLAAAELQVEREDQSNG